MNLVRRLDGGEQRQRQARVDEFLASYGHTLPLVEGNQVSFILRHGTASSVSLVGDLTCWSRSSMPLRRVSGTDLWYLNQTLPLDARVDYKYVVDGSWILDPANPRRMLSGFGENSELAMPGWTTPSAVEYRPDVPHGEVIAHAGFYSSTLRNQREVRVYLPPGHQPGGNYPSLYVHDGLEYLSLAAMNNVLDNLIAVGAIEPLVVVFVPPLDRAAEYGGAKVEAFERFIVHELVPFVDGRYGTATGDQRARGVMGASLGGHISLRLGYDYPDHFGRLAGQSSALWAKDGQLPALFQARRPAGQRIYLSTGNICDNVRINDSFAGMLRSSGYAHEYHVYNEGHSWGFWRKDLERLLTYLWSPNAS